jgi:DNA-binding transcriptional ArsR family regulator
MSSTTPTVHVVRDAEALHALAHPIRVRALEALREPASAAEVARRIRQPRQKVNYHLKQLEQAGLVTRSGERRTGNFIETLYAAAASSFVVSPEVTWADPRRTRVLQAQLSLGELVRLGERLQGDAVALLDRAAFEGATIASASVGTVVRFRSEADRAAFLREYLAAVGRLVDRFAAPEGEPYRLMVAAYPDVGTLEEPR